MEILNKVSKKNITIAVLVLGISSALIMNYFYVKNLENEEPNANTKTQKTEDTTQKTSNEKIKTFEISGMNFSYSKKEIIVNKGDTVKIIFKSTKGYHDWALDEFNAKTKTVEPGETTEAEFIADKNGEFEYYSSVGHDKQFGMVGKIIVK